MNGKYFLEVDGVHNISNWRHEMISENEARLLMPDGFCADTAKLYDFLSIAKEDVPGLYFFSNYDNQVHRLRDVKYLNTEDENIVDILDSDNCVDDCVVVHSMDGVLKILNECGGKKQ